MHVRESWQDQLDLFLELKDLKLYCLTSVNSTNTFIIHPWKIKKIIIRDGTLWKTGWKDNKLSKCQGFVNISTDSLLFFFFYCLSTSLSAHTVHHQQTIFQLTALVHVLMCANKFMYVFTALIRVCVHLSFPVCLCVFSPVNVLHSSSVPQPNTDYISHIQ